MSTLIIPCAGRSTRFPDMRPKWMLTHPDGKLMVEKAIEGMPLETFDRIIITIVREHSIKYEAKIVLEQVFGASVNPAVEIFELEDFTSCQAETVHKTIVEKKVTGNFVVKDSDNQVQVGGFTHPEFIVGLNVNTFDAEVYRLKSKSFLMVNDQGVVVDIIEKKIRSEHICLGVYGFDRTEKFIHAYESLLQNGARGEIYLSHIISYLIGTKQSVYSYVEATGFEDWGTLQDWRVTQRRHATYFVDIDGVLLKNKGKYGTENWSNTLPVIEENLGVLKQLYDDGAQIVFTTCRAEKDLEGFKKMIEERGIVAHSFVTQCNHAPRIMINDFAPSNPYPSTTAINIPRDGSLKIYIQK